VVDPVVDRFHVLDVVVEGVDHLQAALGRRFQAGERFVGEVEGLGRVAQAGAARMVERDGAPARVGQGSHSEHRRLDEGRDGLAADVLRITEPPTLVREQALERLRAAIITGHFAPGARLVERELCEAMGISRKHNGLAIDAPPL